MLNCCAKGVTVGRGSHGWTEKRGIEKSDLFGSIKKGENL